MKAYLTVLPHSQQECINIEGLHKDTYHLWDSIIGHCAKHLSNRQMVDVYKQLCIQLQKIGKNNTPYCYLEMFEEFKKAMKERNVQV